MGTLSIGVDIGGTRMTGALAGPGAEIIAFERRETDRPGGAPAGIRLIFSICAKLIEIAKTHESDISGIGLGFGGPVDARAGRAGARRVRLSHHVAGWEDVELARLVEEKFGIRAVLDNDCNAGALGEWLYGAGRGSADMLYVNIGTGIGGGVINGGRLVRGASGGAGEIGHMIVDPAGPECTCGKRGCLEALASGPAIARRARELATEAGDATRLTREATSEDVFRLAADGDQIARELIDEIAGHLAHAIGNAAGIINPERVVLGGGVSEAGDILLQAIRERIGEYLLPFNAEALTIVGAENGHDAGVLGALALAQNELE